MWFGGVGLIMTLILSLLATPLATDAQPSTQMHRSVCCSVVGTLSSWRHSGRACVTSVTSRVRISSWRSSGGTRAAPRPCG